MRNPNKANGGTPRIISLVIIVSLLLLNFTSCSKQKLSGTYFGEGKERPVDFVLNYVFYYGAQFTIAFSLLFLV